MANFKILSKENMLYNLKKFCSKKVCAMVKANAYGHGIENVVPLIENEVEFFGVSSLEEAKFVRKFTDKRILICSKILDFKATKEFDIMIDNKSDLIKCLEEGNIKNLHLKINCGMNRYGTNCFYELRKINSLLEDNKVKLKSIYTHFHNLENRKETFLNYQRFQDLREEISQDTMICFGGSGTIDYPFEYDILRLGIGLYGFENKNLKPVMSIRSFVSKIFYAKKSDFVGYGKVGKVYQDSKFAVVPVGYADGLRRNLSTKIECLINGKKYNSFGNICMDCFFLEIDENVKEGDMVEFEDITSLAKKAKTISYEILTGLSNFRGKTIFI